MSEFIQLHLLTSYPPSNLNRDDLGRPKTAVMGGVTRLRVSSQSLKRAWRTSDVFVQALGAEGSFEDALGKQVGMRTKDLGNYVHDALLAKKVDPERADEVAKGVAEVFGKMKASKGNGPDERHAARQIEQLAHVSVAEKAAVDALIERVARGEVPTGDEYKGLLSNGHGSADIALFGRMLAANPGLNVDAACQVAHAISVHKVAVEDDFFSAVDDLNKGIDDAGAGHLGTNEFGAALFYQYVCVNRTLLLENLDGDEQLAAAALRGLVEACTKVAPSGKQNSFGSRARASFVLAERGEDQPRSLSVSFLDPVAGEHMHEKAVAKLKSTRDNIDKVYGAAAQRSAWFDALSGESSFDGLSEDETAFGRLCAFVAEGA